jgi:hypothetical protein
MDQTIILTLVATHLLEKYQPTDSLLLLFLFCFLFEAEVGLEFEILLPLPPEC